LLTHPTLDLVRQLGLAGMAKAFGQIEASGEAATLTHPEWLALLLDQEASYRRDRRLHARLRYGDGRYARIQRALGGVQLLILDDWGLEPLDATARHDLLEILEERYGRRSTIITSQIPLDKWHELIGDPTYADAILDRIVHNAHRINLTGHSLRRSRATKASKD
jgi:hypothetical protein